MDSVPKYQEGMLVRVTEFLVLLPSCSNIGPFQEDSDGICMLYCIKQTFVDYSEFAVALCF